jgi:hypothetical protein
MTDEKAPKLSPLELLKKRPMPIFDVVHGTDNPGLKPERKAPQPKPLADRLDGRSLVKDLIPTSTIHALQALKWRLERAEANRKARKGATTKKETA